MQRRRKYKLIKIYLPAYGRTLWYRKAYLNKFLKIKITHNNNGYTVNCREKIDLVVRKLHESSKGAYALGKKKQYYINRLYLKGGLLKAKLLNSKKKERIPAPLVFFINLIFK